jgi:hypothetical protein
MTEYILNRIKITGKLNEKTPGCVVNEIIRSHNICISKPITCIEELLKDIKMIESYRCNTLKEPLGSRDLRILATYVNIDCNTWTKNSLTKAYEHLHSFNKEDINSIYFGQKSYENIDSYNCCMLYSLCIHHKIQTEWNMTPETMTFLLKQKSLSLINLREQLRIKIDSLDKSNLINLMNKIIELDKNNTSLENVVYVKETPKISIPPILNLETKDLIESLNRHRNSSYILQQINPKCHYDAIILAALVYNLNLTESTHPFNEYMRIKEVKSLSFYTPIDPIFRKRYLTNPDWYNLSLYWEPKLNFIYDEVAMKKLCLYEGFDHEDFRNYGFDSLLQISRISLNVFLGKNVYSEDECTSIYLTDFSELDNNECITLGNIETKVMNTYTFNEFADFLIRNKNYINPVKESETLESRIIRKIGIYASKLGHTKILEAIEIVDKWLCYSTEHTQKLRDVYLKNNKIVDILYKIMDSAMYMRGWKVKSEKYPLNESTTLYDKTDNITERIETNVSNSINDVYEKLKEYKEEEIKMIKSLPLMKMTTNKGEISYIVTPEPDDGASMIDRLEIVLKGDKYKNMKSCIRVSSNILLVSVYYYLSSLGIVEPFNIRELDHIS